MVDTVRFARVTALPLQPAPDTMYFVKPAGATAVALFVTGNDSVPYPVIGSGTPAPLPSFLGNPTIQSDGTPQVGEQLVGFDAPVSNLGSNTLTRAWLLGTTVYATTSAYTPQQAGTYRFRNRITVAGVDIDASATVVVAEATPASSFSRQPSITTDGTPTVGEIVSLDFGAISGDTIGTRQILRADNSVVATVTTATYELAAEGQIKLRVYAAATAGLYAETPLLTVAAAAVSTRTAPALSFPEDRAAGTNPPVVQFASTDGTIDKNTDSFAFEYTYAGGTGSGSVALSDLVQVDDQYFTVPGLDNLPAGAFGIRGRFTGPGDPSPWSAILTDTLGAKALPAASTQWNPARRSSHVTIAPSTSGRDAVFENTGGPCGIACDTPRSEARRVDLTFTTEGGRGSSVGFMASTRVISEYDDAGERGAPNALVAWKNNGEVNVSGSEFDTRAGFAPAWGQGDALGMEQQPIMSNGEQTGLRFRFRKNGGAWCAWTDTTITSAVFVAFSRGASVCRLNTGQDAIEATAPSTRWN